MDRRKDRQTDERTDRRTDRQTRLDRLPCWFRIYARYGVTVVSQDALQTPSQNENTLCKGIKLCGLCCGACVWRVCAVCGVCGAAQLTEFCSSTAPYLLANELANTRASCPAHELSPCVDHEIYADLFFVTFLRQQQKQQQQQQLAWYLFLVLVCNL